jgi:hypothetical protein
MNHVEQFADGMTLYLGDCREILLTLPQECLPLLVEPKLIEPRR